MSHFSLLSLALIILFFFSILLCLQLGRRYAIWHKTILQSADREGMKVTQTAIFALFGLLIAFTFASALNKLDVRRNLIIDEANAFITAYSRIDLLPKDSQPFLKLKMRNYLESRLNTYELLPDVNAAVASVKVTAKIKKEIWQSAVSGCRQVKLAYGCSLMLPALNELFMIEFKRLQYTKIHPPYIIFVLLIGVVLISSFLAGYNISTQKLGHAFHALCYAFVVAIVVFVIIDVEYPRLGFIQLKQFDTILINLEKDMFHS